MTYTITIPGVPVAKGRPRFTRSGHTYTPATTEIYEKTVRHCWETQCGTPLPGGVPIFATIYAYFPIPKSYSKKKRQALEGAYHLKKPDADNLAKSVLDALNGCAYPDDSAVQIAACYKIYTNAAPRLELVLHCCEEVEMPLSDYLVPIDPGHEHRIVGCNPCDVCSRNIADCPWLHQDKPVPGWEAERSLLPNHVPVWTWHILRCPLYLPPRPRKVLVPTPGWKEDPE